MFIVASTRQLATASGTFEEEDILPSAKMVRFPSASHIYVLLTSFFCSQI